MVWCGDVVSPFSAERSLCRLRLCWARRLQIQEHSASLQNKQKSETTTNKHHNWSFVKEQNLNNRLNSHKWFFAELLEENYGPACVDFQAEQTCWKAQHCHGLHGHCLQVSISLLEVLFTSDLRWVFAGTWSLGWTSLCFCWRHSVCDDSKGSRIWCWCWRVGGSPLPILNTSWWGPGSQSDEN